MLRRKRIIYLTVLGLFAFSPSVVAETTTNLEELEVSYEETYQEWQNSFNRIDIEPIEFTVNQFVGLEESDDEDVLDWAETESFVIEVEVDEAGLYEIGIDYRLTEETLVPTEGAVMVNGRYPFSESRGINFPSEWVQNETTFKRDRHGADIMPSQSQLNNWQSFKLSDSRRAEPFSFALEAGENTIELIHLRGAIDIASVTIEPLSIIPTYDMYIDAVEDALVGEELVSIEAEHPTVKNESSIRPVVTQDPSVSPYETGEGS